jgi:hypothetical protein
VMSRTPTSVAPRRYVGEEFRQLCGVKGRQVTLTYGGVNDVDADKGPRPTSIQSRSTFFMMPTFNGQHCTYDMMHVVGGIANSVISMLTSENNRGTTMASVFYEKHFNG